MATITLSVPDEIKSRMEAVEVINWSSVARRAFVEQLKYMEELDKVKKIIETSKFKEKESRELFDNLVGGLEDLRMGKIKEWHEIKKENKT